METTSLKELYLEVKTYKYWTYDKLSGSSFKNCSTSLSNG